MNQPPRPDHLYFCTSDDFVVWPPLLQKEGKLLSPKLLRFTAIPPVGGLKSLVQLCLIITIIFLVAGTTILCQPIKIGLLVQDSSYTSAVHGAELAVRMANEKGGLNGLPFRLVALSMEGPWGTGSKKAVELIFKEKVCALMASCDGRNAHIVEQAATKATVVMLSAWSADPTLTQAFVPWFFNVVPTDNQQTAAIAEDIHNKLKTGRVAVISDNDYDSKLSVNALLREFEQRGEIGILNLHCDEGDGEFGNLFRKIKEEEINGIIIFCKPVLSFKIFNKLKQNKIDLPVYGSLALLNEDQLTTAQLLHYDKSLLIPSYKWSQHSFHEFSDGYKKISGKSPGLIAPYSFDGITILINAILKAGDTDREKIQAALEEIEFMGVTGPISFDEMGNRRGKPSVVQLHNGMPVPAGE